MVYFPRGSYYSVVEVNVVRHMNLKVSGRKAELIERIREAVEENPDLLTGKIDTSRMLLNVLLSAALVWPPLVLPTGKKIPPQGTSGGNGHPKKRGRRRRRCWPR